MHLILFMNLFIKICVNRINTHFKYSLEKTSLKCSYTSLIYGKDMLTFSKVERIRKSRHMTDRNKWLGEGVTVTFRAALRQGQQKYCKLPATVPHTTRNSEKS